MLRAESELYPTMQGVVCMGVTHSEGGQKGVLSVIGMSLGAGMGRW